MIPAFVWFAAAILLAFLPHPTTRRVITLAAPLLGTIVLLTSSHTLEISLGSTTLILFRPHDLSFIFTLAFALASFLCHLFAWTTATNREQTSSLLYAGAAIAAVNCGDLISLFIFWELTSLASLLLIWEPASTQTWHAGKRYLLFQTLSGALMLIGMSLAPSTTLTQLDPSTTHGICILLAFGIKAAFPLLHTWLKDSYPLANPSASTMLSPFSTKLAIYTLALCFPGFTPLIFIGLIMTLFPIFFAAIENNLRRVLSYSLNNQLGFMVVGIGIGTPLALNGTAAHAFSHIFYKALLFMSIAAVATRVGTSLASKLGGLARSMPLTAIFCCVGAASISAVPLFSGFVAKSLILEAALQEGYPFIWLGLLIASVGVLEHSGIKIPWFTFFAPPHQSYPNAQEAHPSMLIAMGITAIICLTLGTLPTLTLYNLLPYPISFNPYDLHHLTTQSTLLIFAALAFITLIRLRLYPPEIASTNLDVDWFFRKPLATYSLKLLLILTSAPQRTFHAITPTLISLSRRITLRRLTLGTYTLWLTILLLLTLILFYIHEYIHEPLLHFFSPS